MKQKLKRKMTMKELICRKWNACDEKTQCFLFMVPSIMIIIFLSLLFYIILDEKTIKWLSILFVAIYILLLLSREIRYTSHYRCLPLDESEIESLNISSVDEYVDFLRKFLVFRNPDKYGQEKSLEVIRNKFHSEKIPIFFKTGFNEFGINFQNWTVSIVFWECSIMLYMIYCSWTNTNDFLPPLIGMICFAFFVTDVLYLITPRFFCERGTYEE